MAQYEFVRFDSEYTLDFQGVILPDVLTQLLQCDDFDDDGLVCSAVMYGDIPVAAAVAQLLDEGEVYLYSLYVAPEHRRNHLASEMLDRILAAALDAYSAESRYADIPVNIYLHTEYVLPVETADVFASFLKAYGFKELIEKEPCYLFSSDELKGSAALGDVFASDFIHADDVVSMASIAGDDVVAAAQFLDSFSVDADPEHLFSLRRGDDFPASIAAIHGGENELSLFFSEDTPTESETYISLLKALLQALGRDYEEFSLAVSADRCGCPEFWAELADICGKVFSRAEAGMYIVCE